MAYRDRRDVDAGNMCRPVGPREDTMARFDTSFGWLGRLWRTDAPLTATGLGMTALFVVTLAGLWLDPRTIGGAPAWLKPAKFAASLAVYSLTLAWIFTWLPAWPRLRRVVSRITTSVFVVEMGIIALQAWRGVGSHFNVATLADGVLFSIMGTAILLQTFAALAVTVALWRQTFDNRPMGWALRLGMLITVVAAFSGGLMTQPTTAQLEQARTTGRMTTSGAHTVGARDGGPGLPGTGWSTTHGDLRVAHFLGLHAMQVVPLIGFLVGRLRRGAPAVRLVLVSAASYATLFVLLLGQALRGQSLVAPDSTTLLWLSAWLVLTTTSGWLAARGPVAALSPATR
jgi:hypothetical protein